MIGFFSSSKIQKQGPVGLVPRCGACGLYRTCQSPKMRVYGNGRRGVLVVGEAPGETEDERNRPFVGKAGFFLRETLEQIGVDLDKDAWTTNALICRPPNNRTPDAKQISYCRPNLLNAIRTLEPNVVLTLGKSALTSVLEGCWRGEIGSMERWTGWAIPLQPHWVCPTYHPSYLMRMKNPLMDRLFKRDLERAFAITTSPPKQPSWEKLVEVLYDEKEICESIQEIDAKGGWASVDYETNCLKPEWPDAKIFSCAISNGWRVISYPWTLAARKVTGLFLRSNRTRKISSNLKMEERWSIKEFGHGVENWGWDTMLASHCLDNRPGICSLKFQAFVKMGVPSYNAHIEPYLEGSNGPYNRIHEIAWQDLLFYGGMDAILEYRLAMKQRKELGYD